MLSLPDFRQKQIIFIESKDLKNISYINENLVIKEDDKIIQQVPFFKIFAIFVVGNCTLTSVFIKKMLSYGVMMVLMSLNFKVYATIGGETEGNFLLREKQYLDKNSLLQAKWVIDNKLNNQISLLKKIRGKSEEQKKAITQISELINKIDKLKTPDSLLGIEGNAAKLFFSTYFRELNWHGRKPRTKYDEINVLMDIGYTYLFNFLEAHLRLYGFDNYKGFFHTQFYQRKSLVCDLVEPFRCVIEQAIRKSYNLQQFQVSDFEIKNNKYKLKRGCGKKYAKIFLESILEHKKEMFLFIQQYYRQIIREKNDFPFFKI